MPYVVVLFSTQERARQEFKKREELVKDFPNMKIRRTHLSMEQNGLTHVYIGCDQADRLKGCYIDRVIVEEPIDGNVFNEIINPSLYGSRHGR